MSVWQCPICGDPVPSNMLHNCSGKKNMNVSETGGLRDNKGKAALSLVPRSLLVAVASVIWKSSKDGGGKYPLHNWRKGLYWRDTADCAIRHIYAWLEGEDLDKETGLHHLWHAACNLAFLIEYVITHPNLDNRFKRPAEAEPYK